MPSLFRQRSATIAAFVLLLVHNPAHGAPATGFADPLHEYWTRPPEDRFSHLKAELESGRRELDVSSEKALLVNLLKELDVPVSSQMLVYSATSLQKALINPRNPRALYFNDDTYVGYVPGGRIEVLSVDPHLGGIFYIFDPLLGKRLPRIERSDRCMTCHAPHYMNEIPGLIVESVVPSLTGGGEKAFRREQSGHNIPFEQRFGGWQITGAETFPLRWANIIMEYTAEGRRERSVQFGELFASERYPLPTSDILPHLLHEHQVGFVNRMIEATYQTRASLRGAASPDTSCATQLDETARQLVRYLLFADEVPLPPGGVQGDPGFKSAFLATKKSASNGASLKDFDLRTRLFRYRCSYMIYSPAFAGLPPPLKERLYLCLDRALRHSASDEEFAYLPIAEKHAIRKILKETLPDLSPEWNNDADSTMP